MGIPSWLPADRAPWPDFTAFYKRAVNGLYRQFNVKHSEGTPDSELADVKGEILSAIERLFQWVVYANMPPYDENALFIGRWESIFDLAQQSTTAKRQNAVKGAMRLLGKTATKQMLQLLFAPVFGVNPEQVGICWPTLDNINSVSPENEWQTTLLVFQWHIYDTTESGEVNTILGDTLIQRFESAGYTITYGPRKRAACDTANTCDRSTVG